MGLSVSKADYSIRSITKTECTDLLQKHHYLTGLSRGFKSGDNYGLMYPEPEEDAFFKTNKPLDKIVGVCIFTGLPVPELSKSMFGLDRNNQEGFYELSRLVLHPDHQTEHNLAGWFVARAMKELKENNDVRAILSYADNDYHSGTVYKALGFDYYGLTDPKPDFWIRQEDGTFIKHNRGPTKHLEGEWRPRSRKHRFLKVFDNSLEVKWT